MRQELSGCADASVVSTAVSRDRDVQVSNDSTASV